MDLIAANKCFTIDTVFCVYLYIHTFGIVFYISSRTQIRSWSQVR